MSLPAREALLLSDAPSALSLFCGVLAQLQRVSRQERRQRRHDRVVVIILGLEHDHGTTRSMAARHGRYAVISEYRQ